jgi:3-methyladenine DNA glycosylase AlkC
MGGVRLFCRHRPTGVLALTDLLASVDPLCGPVHEWTDALLVAVGDYPAPLMVHLCGALRNQYDTECHLARLVKKVMGKRELHEQDLDGLFGEFFEIGDPGKLRQYLLANSNLPGRRANLELAWAFGVVIGKRLNGDSAILWQLCHDLTKITDAEAPVNAPGEFLPFCGAVGLGVIGSIDREYYQLAISRLRILASDPRWRMREAVCFGLQRLLANRSEETLNELEKWAAHGNWLEVRSVAAAVAEPELLKNEEILAKAIKLHEVIFNRIVEGTDRKGEGFKVLRKALGYTLSVVVREVPGEGFHFMEQLVATRDKDIVWIVKQNLRKKRLAENFPEEIAEIRRRIS